MGQSDLPCGRGGCCARVHPKRGRGLCQQKAVMRDADGNGWCYYHRPDDPKKFGEGYATARRKEK